MMELAPLAALFVEKNPALAAQLSHLTTEQRVYACALARRDTIKSILRDLEQPLFEQFERQELSREALIERLDQIPQSGSLGEAETMLIEAEKLLIAWGLRQMKERNPNAKTLETMNAIAANLDDPDIREGFLKLAFKLKADDAT